MLLGEEHRMQVKGTSKVGARKDGSGFLESAEQVIAWYMLT